MQTTTGVTAAEYIERRALATVQHLPAIAPLRALFHRNVAGGADRRLRADAAKRWRPKSPKAVAILAQRRRHQDRFLRPTRRAAHALWDMRKGFFASGGAARPKGTSMLTEDVAAPIDRLADFVIDMRKLLDDYGYEDAIIFGHALAGNLHFQMSDNFMEPGAAEKFDRFSKALREFVSVRYGGSLKAEHGTGRAIAPFVEAEWGSKAYALMQRIKPLFDPEGLLNPGVLLNADPHVHIKNLKLMPLADPIVDLCIECGFCEPACPSTHLTLSPAPAHRRRPASGRGCARPARTRRGSRRWTTSFGYAGLATCAAGNVCALRCPVGIETGTMVIGERAAAAPTPTARVAHWVGGHTGAVETGMKLGVGAQAFSPHHHRQRRDRRASPASCARSRPAPSRACRALSPALARRRPGARQTAQRSGQSIPVSAAIMPTARRLLPLLRHPHVRRARRARTACCRRTDAMLELLQARRLRPGRCPSISTAQCCGQPFQSKGFPEEAARVGGELERESRPLSEPASCRWSPTPRPAPSTCASIRATRRSLDSAEFLVTRSAAAADDHAAAAGRRRAPQLLGPAAQGAAADRSGRRAPAPRRSRCSTSVTCCGYAGDKGLFVPELNAHATRFVKADIPADCTHRRLDRLDLRLGPHRARRHPVRLARQPAGDRSASPAVTLA